MLWGVLETLDLRAFTADAKALAGVQGHPLTRVRMLLTVWLHALSIGIGSARRVATMPACDDAFRCDRGRTGDQPGQRHGSVTPMLEQIARRTTQLPKKLLADANHASHASIRRCAEPGVEALIAVPARSRKAGLHGDHDEPIDAWRARMATDEAKPMDRTRPSRCELPTPT